MTPEADRERLLIEATLLNPEKFAECAEIVKPTDFTDPAHQAFWRAMESLAKRGEAIEPNLVVAEARRQGASERIANIARLMSPVQGRAVAYAAPFYAREIANDSSRRQLQGVATRLLQETHDHSREPGQLIDSAIPDLLRIKEARADTGLRPISALATELLPSLEEALERRSPGVGVPSGFAALDQITGGLQPGRTYVLGGRPRHGKSALAAQIGNHAAGAGNVVAVFSLEMTDDEMGLRALSAEACIDSMDMRAGRLSTDRWNRVLSGIESLERRSLFVDSNPYQTPASVAARARALKRRAGRLDLIVIDYLQLLRADERTRTRFDEVSAVSRELAAMSKDLRVPVLVLSQLSRDIEKKLKGVRRPQLSDLRESGQIEQDAHVVMFIYRPELEMDEEQDCGQREKFRGYAELIVRKNRSGPEGLVKMRFEGPTTLFSEDQPGQVTARRS